MNTICDTNTVIDLKSKSGIQTLPKLKISPAPIKPILNSASRANNILINNNCKLYFDKLFLKRSF